MTIRELAKIIEISPATISNVLNGRKGASEETRQKVLNALAEYHYIPNPKNPQKKREILLAKFRQSGSLIEENQGFITMIIDSIEATLKQEGFGLSTAPATKKISELCASNDFSKYAGLILIASEITEEMYPDLADISIPFVVVDNPVPHYAYSSVCMNNFDNVYLALSYCRQCGHREIGYLRSAVDFENFRERNKAFHTCIGELGFQFDPTHEFRVQPTLLGAYEGILSAIYDGISLPSCFFADNDTIALGAMKALKEKGFRIPNDISIIGFDDIPFATVSSPALTTVHVQRKSIGRQVVYQLLRTIADDMYVPVKSTITGRLIIRGSVKNLNVSG